MEIDLPPARLIDGRIAFFTFATRGFAPFVLNLHASLRRHDPALADKLIAFCADRRTAAELAAEGVCTVACDSDDLPEFAEFEGPGFGRVVSCKFALARRLLRSADYVWWCDGDVVARDALGDRILDLVAGSDADLLMQCESPGDRLNTGFWIARRSPAVDDMLADMAEQTARADVDDQAYFNERHARAGDVTIAALDPDEFACGNRFYHRHLRGAPRGRVLHFNYAVGRGNKQELMRQHGAWYLEQPRSVARRARLRHLRLTLRGRIGARRPRSAS
ncbi:MAG TPA: putative nucleotide-diphospho-sugar transferase [Solirubrobacteraceae bacterium]|jgi:hypothetical protein|nr:putative nucleotide-diphospho-sugar transferase [Solirubrobacteraceae bacterium]